EDTLRCAHTTFRENKEGEENNFIPMKSLSCYNDYNSQMTCTWMEHSEAHALVGMILYHRRDIT
uniref:Cytokine receptor common subunit beta N-terminal domain-containing protein n=1 Tax=Otus sunia TaxID=257818 RepID=A0A8C8E9J1_9STRI